MLDHHRVVELAAVENPIDQSLGPALEGSKEKDEANREQRVRQRRATDRGGREIIQHRSGEEIESEERNDQKVIDSSPVEREFRSGQTITEERVGVGQRGQEETGE